MPRSGVLGTYSLPPGTTPQQPNTVIQSAMFNAFAEDVKQTNNTPIPIAYGGTNASTAEDARANLGGAATIDIRGYIYGLTLSNNSTDAANDINIAAGSAVDSTGTSSIVLANAMGKQLDAVWAPGGTPGTPVGMRASGASLSNATYHIFVIRRPDTGAVDVAADTSPTGANIPANTNVAYTQRQRIGAIIRESGSIVSFVQRGNIFKRVPAVVRSSTSPQVSALLACPVPNGTVVEPIFSVEIQTVSAPTNASCAMGDGSGGSATTTYTGVLTSTSIGGRARNASVFQGFFTNTTTQVYHSVTIGEGSLDANTLYCVGWVDPLFM